jgi:hypothetical protein
MARRLLPFQHSLSVVNRTELHNVDRRTESTAPKQNYRVAGLPGVEGDDLTSPQYAGFIEVDAATNANIFYWLFEADSPKASELPLAIWYLASAAKILNINFYTNMAS